MEKEIIIQIGLAKTEKKAEKIIALLKKMQPERFYSVSEIAQESRIEYKECFKLLTDLKKGGVIYYDKTQGYAIIAKAEEIITKQIDKKIAKLKQMKKRISDGQQR